jgi:uncharacterized protein (DUF2235 family)
VTDGRAPGEPRNIVICCDGTGNEVSGNLSNVLKLFRIAVKDEGQHVYYHPGVGTIGTDNAWEQTTIDLRSYFRLATGAGLDDDILRAYCFLVRTYRRGDRVFLFGFSRGAYTVRALAGFIHMIGLLRPDQSDLSDFALTTYKRAGWRSEDIYDEAKRRDADTPAPVAPGGLSAAGERSRAAEHATSDRFAAAWQFGKVTGTLRVPIHFLGVWDTVSSIIVPGPTAFSLPRLRTLPYTRINPSVRAFRHAIAIDERRRMFRPNWWIDGQLYDEDPFSHPPVKVPQDCVQHWFAGVHSDVGGGYPEEQSALAKLPLIWMIEEAEKSGLRIDGAAFDRIARGTDPRYVKPDPCGPIHNSLTAGWKVLEVIPKSSRWREWWRYNLFGFYFPLGEPRPIETRAVIAPSTRTRQRELAGYDPVNLEPKNRGRTVPPEWWIWSYWRVILSVFASGALGAFTIWLLHRILRCLFC